jgi:exopolysaccharide production protein ExoZ
MAFLALSPHRDEFTSSDALFSLLLVPHVIALAGNMHPIVAQGWTLQYEVLFYLLFAAGLLLTRRTGPLLVAAALVALVGIGQAIMPLSDMAEPQTLAWYWTRPILLLFTVDAHDGEADPHGDG